jgi:hypothetical protein
MHCADEHAYGQAPESMSPTAPHVSTFLSSPRVEMGATPALFLRILVPVFRKGASGPRTFIFRLGLGSRQQVLASDPMGAGNFALSQSAMWRKVFAG